MKKLSVLTICLSLATLGCSEKLSRTETPMIKEYTKQDKPIEITIGQQFAIKLVSNPTTGYGWQLSKSLDEKVVSLLTNTYVQKKIDTRMVSVGGHETWTFKAVGQGKTDISMQYLRPWEKDVPAVETNVFSVVVK